LINVDVEELDVRGDVEVEIEINPGDTNWLGMPDE